MTTPEPTTPLQAAADVYTAARIIVARDAWDAALLAKDYDAADRLAAEVAELEADLQSRRPGHP